MDTNTRAKFYFLVESQATGRVQVGDAVHTIPVFVKAMVDGKEYIPFFLSKLHAYMSLSALGETLYYRVATSDDMSLRFYRDASVFEMEGNESVLGLDCRLFMGFTKGQGDGVSPIWLHENFLFREVFLNHDKIHELLKSRVGQFYEQAISDDKMSHEVLMEKANQCLLDLGLNLDNQKTDHSPEEITESLKSGGEICLFAMQHDQKFSPVKLEGEVGILLFVNKADAAIFSLIEQSKSGRLLEPVLLHANKGLVHQFRKGGLAAFVCYGFYAYADSFECKWVKVSDNMPYPAARTLRFSWDEIEHGFNIDHYLMNVSGAEERKIAIAELMKTNMTSFDELLSLGKEVIQDMKQNAIVLSTKDKRVSHRYIFCGG